jgi:endonuclease/exonuclease/phosphatase family metal-dependent hydrolase
MGRRAKTARAVRRRFRPWVIPLLLPGLSCGGERDASPPVVSGDAAGVWASAAGCAAALAAGERLPRDAGRVRLATWNLRWFPRGCPPDRECPGQETDVEWLACGIAWMQVDVLAVQEVLRSGAGERGLAALTRALEALAGGRWRNDVQACGESGAQAVGFVWNAERVTLEDHADLWELNGDRRARPRDACAARLRPGRYARLRGPGGLDASLVVVHLDSGRRELDWERRRRALARLGEARVRGRRLVDLEEDVVALGDFNSMGRGDAPEVTPHQEIARLQAELGGAFRRALPDRECTGYYRQGPGLHARTLLDHLLPSAAMEEAGAGAQVAGYCAALDCPARIRGAMPAAFERLSDHCPVLLDLEDRDRDGP